MKIDGIEVVEYLPTDEYPTECIYGKTTNLGVLVKERQFEWWAKLDIHWIFSTMKWWRWN